DNIVIRPADRAVSLHENDRFVGNFGACFLGVIEIIQTNADELPNLGDRATQPRIPINKRQIAFSQASELVELVGMQHVAGQVGNHTGQIAKAALGIDEAWPLGACISIPYEFHKPTPESSLNDEFA